MALEAAWTGLTEAVKANSWLADPIAFALGFSESIVFFSWLVPSSVLLVALGSIHGAAGGSLVELWLAASAGCFLGDIASYLMGRTMKGTIERMWPLRAHPEWLPRAHAFMEKWGILGVIVGKFIGPLRPFIPLASGIAEMAWPQFLAASAVSSLVWAAVFLLPGVIGTLWLFD